MLQISRLTDDRVLCFDGAMGTMLQSMGYIGLPFPESLNLTHSRVIREIHEAYLRAGCDIVKTNTFGANCFKAQGTPYDADETVAAGTVLARQAADSFSASGHKRYVALDIGPTGKLLKPLGTLDFEGAVSAFGRMARIGEQNGADFILIETMNDTYELKAAVLGAKEHCALPIVATVTLDERGKLLTGGSIGAVVALLEGLGVAALGVNCGLGPDQVQALMPELTAVTSVPIAVSPNAGLPHSVDGKTFFTVGPEEFAASMAAVAAGGARLLGGCCGTTPAHIEKMIEAAAGHKPAPLSDKGLTWVSSYAQAAVIGGEPVLIGERINPTGKKPLKEALRGGDYGYILNEAIEQQKAGAHVLDVNAGLPDIDEAAVMAELVARLQAVVTLPLQIDSGSPRVLETALRLYNGKALINSTTGKADSMDAVFALAAKYGGVVVGLTLDEGGIPETPEGRLAVARKIVNRAAEYGIAKKDILIDPLTLTVSADSAAAVTTLRSLALIKSELGVRTVLGVSNVSFGLPEREAVHAAFCTLAVYHGLDAAILNPGSAAMLRACRTGYLLAGRDVQCKGYIAGASGAASETPSGASPKPKEALTLTEIILRGLKDQAYAETMRLLETTPPLELIDKYLAAALNIVGAGFEKGEIFLPQLLLSAETVKNAFEAVKTRLSAVGEPSASKGTIVVATVQGDIHDIGKNIVKTMLENYGYEIIDLGRDVPVRRIVDTVAEKKIRLLGLSALMTTTVPAMEEVIRELAKGKISCKVMVGGAVLTQTYADRIGADFYAKDAMGAVHCAQKVFG
jgi:5-methyltetrahydrofolate--homocysteine methyltransferase